MFLHDDACDVKPPLQIAHIKSDNWIMVQQAQILTGHGGWQENTVTPPQICKSVCPNLRSVGGSVALEKPGKMN